MRDLVAQTLTDLDRFVTQMDTSQWTLAFVAVVVFGALCMRGVGSKVKN